MFVCFHISQGDHFAITYDINHPPTISYNHRGPAGNVINLRPPIHRKNMDIVKLFFSYGAERVTTVKAYVKLSGASLKKHYWSVVNWYVIC